MNILNQYNLYEWIPSIDFAYRISTPHLDAIQSDFWWCFVARGCLWNYFSRDWQTAWDTAK